MRQTWWETHDFPDYMNVAECAEALAWGVRAFGETIREEFNGTPMVAYPSDNARTILLRWHYERILFQLKQGFIDFTDITLEEMPN
jgi:hypothetical protein